MPHGGQKIRANPRKRMVELRIRFWTDELAGEKGYIMPKHAWTSGVVRMERNDSHGIEPQNARHFNSLMEIPSAIEKVLIQHGVKLHLLRNMAKYIE